MSSKATGLYKFDNRNEKLDEVELVNEDYENIRNAMNNTDAIAKQVPPNRGVFRMMHLMMQLLIIILLLILMGMTAYNMAQESDGNQCACDAANPEERVSQNSDDITCTFNATVMQGYIDQAACRNDTKMWQAIETHNNHVVNVMESASRDILQLLHELQSMDIDFQENTTKMLENTEDHLLHIINTLSNHKDTSISTSSVVDDILIGVNELLDIHNTSSLYDSITPVSCKMIKEKLPNSPSGYYHVNARDIYCNMDVLCGSGGGWTRLGYLDMTDSTVDCPDELEYATYDDVRVCQRPRPGSYTAGCSSPVKFPSNGISYTEICGRVIGYQYASTDAVSTGHGPISEHNDINSYYVDGISLTKGSPRQHVWTFIAGIRENYQSAGNCPCNSPPPGSTQQLQSFVGSNYFCESGNPNSDWTYKLYTADPLWDGKGCGSQEGPCCSVPGLPWFHRQYDNMTTDSLDMRICGDETASITNEDTPVSFYEIFVK